MTSEREFRPAGRLRVYRAEYRASQAHPVEPLDGTRAVTQAYVDRITRSAWWKRTCPPSWLGDERCSGIFLDTSRPPRRIIIEHGTGAGAWAGRWIQEYRGRNFPVIQLGDKPQVFHETGIVRPPPLADPWVILHEIAHIMACSDDARGHGREFARFYLLLVRRWLGPDAARALREGYAAEGVKYRSK